MVIDEVGVDVSCGIWPAVKVSGGQRLTDVARGFHAISTT